LRPDDRQCSGCGMPNTLAETKTSESYPPPPPPPPPSQQAKRPSRPYTPPPPYAPKGPYSPPQNDTRPKSIPKPDPRKLQPGQKGSAAKCAKCGAIVYDHESRCSNCGRVLAPPPSMGKPVPPKPGTKPVAPVGKAPPGTARCSKCNAIVYPHHTHCPNCNRRLDPIQAPSGPGQRISRCKRCGHTVYPTDKVCPNCNRKLNPI
jgi:uncharacterized OB-fold protein